MDTDFVATLLSVMVTGRIFHGQETLFPASRLKSNWQQTCMWGGVQACVRLYLEPSSLVAHLGVGSTGVRNVVAVEGHDMAEDVCAGALVCGWEEAQSGG